MIANPGLEALPTARGYEFGVKTRLLPRTEIFATYWFLDLASELVFVGDEGTTEARGRSRREGLEVGAKVKLLDWLTLTGDFTYTATAEFVDTGCPFRWRPIWTARADLTARLPFGLSSSLEMRHLGDRIADDFGHHTARGYTLFNATTRYRYKNFEAFLTRREPDEHRLAGGAVLLHLTAARRAGRRRRRHPFHARHAALLLRRHRLAFLSLGAPTWPPNPLPFVAPRRSRVAPLFSRSARPAPGPGVSELRETYRCGRVRSSPGLVLGGAPLRRARTSKTIAKS